MSQLLPCTVQRLIMPHPLSSKILATVISPYVASVEQYRKWIISTEKKKAKNDQIKLDLKSPVCIILERRDQEEN